MHKKGSYIDLLYLTLIVSVLRTQNPFDDNVLGQAFGGSAVDELGPTSAVHLYLHNPFETRLFSSNAKTSILYEETLDILRDINSLGRYSRHNRFHDSPVFAYLVSGGEEQRQASPLRPTIASTSSSSISSSVNIVESSQSISESVTSETSEDSTVTESNGSRSATPFLTDDDQVLISCPENQQNLIAIAI